MSSEQSTLELFNIDFLQYSKSQVFDSMVSGAFDQKIVVTPNVDHIVRYYEDDSFKSIYDKCDIFLNDSKILKLLSKFSKKPLKTVVPGSDLTQIIFERAEFFAGYEFTVIGATSKDITSIQKIYNKRINHIEPSYGFINRPTEVENIVNVCKQKPKAIYFIAVGSPQQEILAKSLSVANVEGVFLCIGASILFLSGSEKRAPRVLRFLHLEWLFRFLMSPRRLFKRYFVNGPKIFLILYRYLKHD